MRRGTFATIARDAGFDDLTIAAGMGAKPPPGLDTRGRRRWARRTLDRWAMAAGARTRSRDSKSLARAEYARRELRKAEAMLWDAEGSATGSPTRLRAHAVYLERLAAAMDAERTIGIFQIPRHNTPMQSGVTGYEAVEQRLADVRRALAQSKLELRRARRDEIEKLTLDEYGQMSASERAQIEVDLGLNVEPEIGDRAWEVRHSDGGRCGASSSAEDVALSELEGLEPD